MSAADNLNRQQFGSSWKHQMRGPNDEWLRGPGSHVEHSDYGHGVVEEVKGRHATVRFDNGTRRTFGSLMEHEPVGEDKFFKARIGPTEDDVPNPEHLERHLAPEIPSTDQPWGSRYNVNWQAGDRNMVGYTTKGNGAIEASLRRGEQPEPPMDVGRVDSVIASRHLKQPTLLYRGIAITPELDKKLVPGAEFSDKSYTSTTTAPQWADEFADFRVTGKAPWKNKDIESKPLGGKPGRLVLHAPAGQEIGPGEPALAEYVLPRDSRYRVTQRMTHPSGREIIHAEVLPHGEHAPLKHVDYPDPREKWLSNRRIDPVTGAVSYGGRN